MKNSIFAALGLICFAGAANAETSADNSHRSIERRAVEAVIWGMPAVNFPPNASCPLAGALRRKTAPSSSRAHRSAPG